jgi:hypothetical protein
MTVRQDDEVSAGHQKRFSHPFHLKPAVSPPDKVELSHIHGIKLHGPGGFSFGSAPQTSRQVKRVKYI